MKRITNIALIIFLSCSTNFVFANGMSDSDNSYKKFLSDDALSSNNAVYDFVALLAESRSENADVMFEFKNKDEAWKAFQNFALHFKNNFSHEQQPWRKHFNEFGAIAHLFLEATYKVVDQSEKHAALYSAFSLEIHHRHQAIAL